MLSNQHATSRSGRIIRALNARTLFLFVATTACSGEDPQTIEVWNDEQVDVRSWETFLAEDVVQVSDGHYIVEGDLPIDSLEALRAHYVEHYSVSAEKSAVRRHNGADDVWPNGDQRRLEYCVSTSFPATGFWSRSNVIAAMAAATQRWQRVAGVRFTYVPSRDSDCLSGSSNPHNRFFKVAPKSINGAFACAFFPISRSTCPELDGSTVGVSTGSQPALSATRTLTHELGHVLGLFHEYSRSDADCPTGTSRNLTAFDPASIMHASNGNCGGSPTETLSNLDGIGIRSLYGVPAAWLVPITYPYL